MNQGDRAVVSVVGAGGVTGRAVLGGLTGRVLSRAVIRRAEQEEGVVHAGAIEVAVADYSEPGSLELALEGANAVYLIVPQFSPYEREFVATAAAAARRAGVGRLVYHSVLHPYTPAMRHHLRKADAENIVRDSGLDWTILQPAMYAETVRTLFPRSGDADVVRVPYRLDARFSLVALRDVGEAAASVLSDGSHIFATYELAGPECRTIESYITELAGLWGRSVEPQQVALGEAPFAPQWGPSAVADAAAMWAHYDAHGLTGNPAVLESLLGRPATKFADALRGGDHGP